MLHTYSAPGDGAHMSLVAACHVFSRPQRLAPHMPFSSYGHQLRCDELFPARLQAFLLSNKEAILSLLQNMDRHGQSRDARSPTSSHPERSGNSSSGSRSSQRSYSTENAKAKEAKSCSTSSSSRDNLYARVDERRVRVYSRSNSVNRSRSRSGSRTPSRSIRHRDVTPRRRRDHRCIGIFGMNVDTSERDLENIFQEFGEIDYAKEELKDARIDGMRVRVDFSVTNGSPGYRPAARPRRHVPTPRSHPTTKQFQ
ncbi:unnamed protein product [Heligmosomoides polygyrus]|uniref:RRM domain-containing protein n=1 Tax=Heligmosomoides polygyrus TaxID=6339 RepID=A0A3P7ZG61_HELPZ|nr:unnamed protein product [Heligmosomoides polygyrus]